MSIKEHIKAKMCNDETPDPCCECGKKEVNLICDICCRSYCNSSGCWIAAHDQYFNWKKRPGTNYYFTEDGCDNCNYGFGK